MKYSKFLLIFVSLIFLNSCKSKEKTKQERILNVHIAEVVEKETPIYIYAVGNTQANFTIDIRSQVTGVLLKAHVKEGQNVKEGDLIYTIDPAPYEAELQKAKAQLREDQASLKLAEDKVKRYESLAEKDFISQLQFDEYVTNVELFKAKVDVDKANILDAEVNLNYCFIHAPVSGKISYNVLDPGNLITANSSNALTSIRQMDPMQVNFSISQRDFLKWQREHVKGEEFDFIILDSDKKQLVKRGKVFFIDNNIDQQNGTILLKGAIENKDFALWPGEFGEVHLILKKVNGLLIPESALQIGEDSPYVFVMNDQNIVQMKDVTVIQNLEKFLLVTGLESGEKVVTSGQLNLRSGMKVNVIQPQNTKLKDDKEPKGEIK